MRTKSIAKALGWFSIGLGLTELLAPHALGRSLGTCRHGLLRRTRGHGLFRGFGLREIAVGIGILASDNMAPWIWARVAGDTQDLAMLGFAIARGKRRNAIAAAGAVAGVTALDAFIGQRLTSGRHFA